MSSPECVSYSVKGSAYGGAAVIGTPVEDLVSSLHGLQLDDLFAHSHSASPVVQPISARVQGVFRETTGLYSLFEPPGVVPAKPQCPQLAKRELRRVDWSPPQIPDSQPMSVFPAPKAVRTVPIGLQPSGSDSSLSSLGSSPSLSPSPLLSPLPSPVISVSRAPAAFTDSVPFADPLPSPFSFCASGSSSVSNAMPESASFASAKPPFKMRARATEFVPRMVSPVVAQASSGPRPGVQSFQLLRPLYQAQTSPPQPVRGPDFRDSVLVEPLQPQQIYANMLLSSYAPATRCAIVDTSK